MIKIVVIGGKGTAVCIAEQIVHAHRQYGAPFEFLGWAIDDPALGDTINGFPLLCGTREVMQKFPQADVKCIFALYKPDRMRERVALLKSYGLPAGKFATFVHPSAVVLPGVTLGHGTVVLSNTTLHSNVTVGNNAILNPNVVVEHDTRIGASAFISSAACLGSEVQIGEGAFIGLNATVREGVTIGDYAFVGMGANVLDPVAADTLVYGNPARVRSWASL